MRKKRIFPKQIVPKKCNHGHLMSPDNCYLEKRRDGVRRDRIRCRECLRIGRLRAKHPEMYQTKQMQSFKEWSAQKLSADRELIHTANGDISVKTMFEFVEEDRKNA